MGNRFYIFILRGINISNVIHQSSPCSTSATCINPSIQASNAWSHWNAQVLVLKYITLPYIWPLWGIKGKLQSIIYNGTTFWLRGIKSFERSRVKKIQSKKIVIRQTHFEWSRTSKIEVWAIKSYLYYNGMPELSCHDKTLGYNYVKEFQITVGEGDSNLIKWRATPSVKWK